MFAPMKCSRPWNVRAHEMFASMKSSRPWNVRAHEMFAPMKCSRPWNVRFQTLTIWARQNLQLLSPSQSGWRALSRMVLPLLHAVLKWDLLSDLPSLFRSYENNGLRRHRIGNKERETDSGESDLRSLIHARWLLGFNSLKTRRAPGWLKNSFSLTLRASPCPNTCLNLLERYQTAGNLTYARWF